MAARAAITEATEERAVRGTSITLLEDTMTATALREAERDAEEIVVALEALPEELPQPLNLEVLLL